MNKNVFLHVIILSVMKRDYGGVKMDFIELQKQLNTILKNLMLIQNWIIVYAVEKKYQAFVIHILFQNSC